MPKLTEEERKEHRRIATARYRLKKGVQKAHPFVILEAV